MRLTGWHLLRGGRLQRGAASRNWLRTITGRDQHDVMDPGLAALVRSLTRLDQDAAYARLHRAAGGGEEGVAEIMRGEVEQHPCHPGMSSNS